MSTYWYVLLGVVLGLLLGLVSYWRGREKAKYMRAWDSKERRQMAIRERW